MVGMIGLVWQAITFLGLIIVVPIIVAAILGRKEKTRHPQATRRETGSKVP